VISALSGADKVFKALELGALDFVVKPCGTASVDLLSIKDDLRQKVLQIVALKPRGISALPPAKTTVATFTGSSPAFGRIAGEIKHSIDIVAIGASTGGPPALQQIFSSFEHKYPFAVVVSQHMPSGFTKAFADRLDRSSPFDIKEAEDGDPVLPGSILIAPGGKNMVFEMYGCQIVARIMEPTKTDRYVPSIDVMFESCAGIYRKRAAAVILTGMGNDGSQGIRHIKAQGGYVIAESEESSVVYGMPREAAATGLVDRIVPLHCVSNEIISLGGFA
ncbi:MAG: chemotaxis response regulator protein-glutamate methylesterase, partial [Steroidobacteraceae bacterium]|nr:chemotaxis response regulator protein-glutamate methylesterase [Deltaproteobacteria bacterium]